MAFAIVNAQCHCVCNACRGICEVAGGSACGVPVVKLKDFIDNVWQAQTRTRWPVRTLRGSQRSVAANAEHGRLAPILHAYFAVQTHALRRIIAPARAGGGAEAVTAEELLHLHRREHESLTETREAGKRVDRAGQTRAEQQSKVQAEMWLARTPVQSVLALLLPHTPAHCGPSASFSTQLCPGESPNAPAPVPDAEPRLLSRTSSRPRACPQARSIQTRSDHQSTECMRRTNSRECWLGSPTTIASVIMSEPPGPRP